jgi:hypothetical protein
VLRPTTTDRVAELYPQAPGPLFVPFNDSQGYGGGILSNPPPNGVLYYHYYYYYYSMSAPHVKIVPLLDVHQLLMLPAGTLTY